MGMFDRVLITGINGSGGSYLADYIEGNHPNVQVYGFSRWRSKATRSDNLGSRIIYEVDLLDTTSIVRALMEIRPDAVFHLAAHANVGVSFKTPATVVDNNVRGTINLLEAIRLVQINPIIQICSSSEVYGQVELHETPISENNPLRPASPYAVSKVAQDLLGDVYFRAYGMRIIRTRMFSYVNPRRDDLFASSFAKQIVRIEKGLSNELRHGNLESVRTLLDVRDAVEAYWVAVRDCKIGEVYNIGGNRTITVGDVLRELIIRSPIKDFRLVEDESLLRPKDVTLQIPNVNKFKQRTGWEPKYSFEESMEFLLDYWRRKVN